MRSWSEEWWRSGSTVITTNLYFGDLTFHNPNLIVLLAFCKEIKMTDYLRTLKSDYENNSLCGLREKLIWIKMGTYRFSPARPLLHSGYHYLLWIYPTRAVYVTWELETERRLSVSYQGHSAHWCLSVYEKVLKVIIIFCTILKWQLPWYSCPMTKNSTIFLTML